MPKTDFIELGDETRLPILYEDRSVLAIDKPVGWMLVPLDWQKTPLNLQAAINSSLGAGAYWARCRNLRFLQYVHRLDAETTGILLFVKSQGAVRPFSQLFESRRMEKLYLAVLTGQVHREKWTRTDLLGPDPAAWGRMRVDPEAGKEAVTEFTRVAVREGLSLVEARPVTGRTHQIRLHALASGHPVLGDPLYGPRRPMPKGIVLPLALRSVQLRYTDPFTRKSVHIEAPAYSFLEEHGFAAAAPRYAPVRSAPAQVPAEREREPSRDPRAPAIKAPSKASPRR